MMVPKPLKSATPINIMVSKQSNSATPIHMIPARGPQTVFGRRAIADDQQSWNTSYLGT